MATGDFDLEKWRAEFEAACREIDDLLGQVRRHYTFEPGCPLPRKRRYFGRGKRAAKVEDLPTDQQQQP